MPPLLREIYRCLYQHGSPAPSRPFRHAPVPARTVFQSMPPRRKGAPAVPLYPPRAEKAMGGTEVCISFTEVFPGIYRPALLRRAA